MSGFKAQYTEMLQPWRLQRTVEPEKSEEKYRMSSLKPFGNTRKYRETGGKTRKTDYVFASGPKGRGKRGKLSPVDEAQTTRSAGSFV